MACQQLFIDSRWQMAHYGLTLSQNENRKGPSVILESWEETNEESRRKGHHTTPGLINGALLLPGKLPKLGQPARQWGKESSLGRGKFSLSLQPGLLQSTPRQVLKWFRDKIPNTFDHQRV